MVPQEIVKRFVARSVREAGYTGTETIVIPRQYQDASSASTQRGTTLVGQIPVDCYALDKEPDFLQVGSAACCSQVPRQDDRVVAIAVIVRERYHGVNQLRVMARHSAGPV